MIIPRAIYADPFRGGDNILVMCDSYEPNKPGQGAGELKPIPTNTRYACAKFCDAAKAEEPWFGIEQEYTLLNTHTKWPLGWPTSGYPGPQGETGEGERVARGSVFLTSLHSPATTPRPPLPSLQAPTTAPRARARRSGATSLKPTTRRASSRASTSRASTPRWDEGEGGGVARERKRNNEKKRPLFPPFAPLLQVMPAQWEYQVGPCVGVDGADQLWMSRYILLRVCEVGEGEAGGGAGPRHPARSPTIAPTRPPPTPVCSTTTWT